MLTYSHTDKRNERMRENKRLTNRIMIFFSSLSLVVHMLYHQPQHQHCCWTLTDIVGKWKERNMRAEPYRIRHVRNNSFSIIGLKFDEPNTAIYSCRLYSFKMHFPEYSTFGRRFSTVFDIHTNTTVC